MADLAILFGWSLDVMDRMTLQELLDWHARAIERAHLRVPQPCAFASGGEG